MILMCTLFCSFFVEADYHEALSRTSSQGDFLSCDDLDDNDARCCDFEPFSPRISEAGETKLLTDGFSELPPPFLDELVHVEKAAEMFTSPPPEFSSLKENEWERPEVVEVGVQTAGEEIMEVPVFVEIIPPPRVLIEAAIQTLPEPQVDRMLSSMVLEEHELLEAGIQTSPVPRVERNVSPLINESVVDSGNGGLTESQLGIEDIFVEEKALDMPDSGEEDRAILAGLVESPDIVTGIIEVEGEEGGQFVANTDEVVDVVVAFFQT